MSHRAVRYILGTSLGGVTAYVTYDYNVRIERYNIICFLIGLGIFNFLSNIFVHLMYYTLTHFCFYS